MAQYGVAPTKTNLIRLKIDAQFAQEGHTLLEQKREILTAELMGLVDKAKDIQKQLDGMLAHAYTALHHGVITQGHRSLASIGLAVNTEWEASVSQRKIMGVAVPVINARHREYTPFFSVGNTTFWIDETIHRFKECVLLIAKFTEIKISVLRLAREVNKTLRRVNALEKICLPDYKETIKYIEESLEEEERAQFSLLKLIKTRMESKKGRSHS